MQHLKKNRGIITALGAVAITAALAVLAFVSGYLGSEVKTSNTPPVYYEAPKPIPSTPLGSSNTIETPVALFSTSLASGISAADTSMTLVSGTTYDGTTLASSTYSFIIDEGTASQEFVKADCTATACVHMDRGLSALTGTTTVSGKALAHRRGASVKITDAPLLINLTRLISGIGLLPNPLRYNSNVTTSQVGLDNQNLASVAYANSLSFGAVPAASETASGFVELATTLEGASSTSSGSAARLVIPASSATSTYNSATAPLRVVVTQNSGKIDNNFINANGLLPGLTVTSATTTFATTSLKIGDFPAYEIGKNQQVFTNSGTFTVPNGITKVWVEAVGGGGAGGQFTTSENSGADGTASRFSTFLIAGGGSGGVNGNSGGANSAAGGGGASGAYCRAAIDISATSSIAITIGTGGSGTKADSSDTGAGGAAGSCTGTATNVLTIANAGVSSISLTQPGYGGGNPYGYGTIYTNTAGVGYGAGGSGKISGSGAGAGKAGILIVSW